MIHARGDRWNPAGDRNQGYLLIENEGITTRKHSLGTWYAMSMLDSGDFQNVHWSEFTSSSATDAQKRRRTVSGPTMLTAAMRCLVLTKRGEIVTVPRLLIR